MDQPIQTLPRWLVSHICRPRTHKLLGKQPKFWSSTQTHSGYGHAPGAYHDSYRGQIYVNGRGFVPLSKIERDVLPGHYRDIPITAPEPPSRKLDQIPHLDNNDYRLWAEVREIHDSSHLIKVRCRWCNERFFLRQWLDHVKTNHKQFCQFTHNLRAVFQILRDKGQCVVCNRHTPHEAWGLPMCNESCVKAWRFAERTSGYMAAAMHNARYNNLLREEPKLAATSRPAV